MFITEILQKRTINNKKILLGITGGIAAYKAASLCRLLIKQGAQVKIICTPDALNFVTPLTLSTLSANPVYVDFYKNDSGEWNNHVELAKWADIMIIAPATANTIAKMAVGICDNFLLATYLSATCPIFYAPAMDLDMYQHPTFTANSQLLKNRGHFEIEAEVGFLASGLEGKGRMAEPENIINTIIQHFSKVEDLKGVKCLLTAGPTYEAIDPVRFIGNHSSGKMGIALANELADRGAEVNLVLGPVASQFIHANVEVHHVVSSDEMAEKVFELFEECTIIICSAAVADYKPASVSQSKIKKSNSILDLKLEKTTDILANLGKRKKNNQILIGFALETDNEVDNAMKKLNTKNADIIVLNSMNDKGAGFKSDTNKVTILSQNKPPMALNLKPKTEVAKDIIDFVKNFQ